MKNQITTCGLFLCTRFFLVIFFVVVLHPLRCIEAASPALSSGKNLLQPTSARATALGEAFTASADDIGGFAYNPGVLNSLRSGQASLIFNRGLADDTYGNALLGMPLSAGTLGVSFGYYDGGNIDLFDGSQQRTVRAQTDYLFSTGYGWRMGRFDVGIAGKYISSQIGDVAQANAAAVDAGLNYTASRRLRYGFALQNYGTSLKYETQAEKLPRTVRGGLGAIVLDNKYAPTLYLDVPYLVNEKDFRPAGGLESWIGPFALRAGYRTGVDLAGFSFGVGFLLGPVALNYSFDLVQTMNNQQHVNLLYRFAAPTSATALAFRSAGQPVFGGGYPPMAGGGTGANALASGQSAVGAGGAIMSPISASLSPIPPDNNLDDSSQPEITFLIGTLEKTELGYIYKIQEGDTLAEISQRYYHSKALAWRIYMLNRKNILDPQHLKPGQKIILPRLGDKKPAPLEFKKPDIKPGVDYMYTVQPGDTWKSISQKVFGTPQSWRFIYMANQHLVSDPEAPLKPGMKLILPR